MVELAVRKIREIRKTLVSSVCLFGLLLIVAAELEIGRNVMLFVVGAVTTLQAYLSARALQHAHRANALMARLEEV